MNSSSTGTSFHSASEKLKWGMKILSELPERNSVSQLNQHPSLIRREIKLSASVIPYIHYALKQLKRMENGSSSVDKLKFMILKQWLKNLRTFILCARNLVNKDQNLDNLIRRIEDGVWSRSQAEISPNFLKRIIHFRQQIKCFEEEMAKCYITLSQFPSSSTTEVMEFTHSLLENLVDFLSFSLPSSHKEFLVELVLALKEEIAFRRNLIRFAMLLSVDQQLLKNLLTHLETVAVNAAHLSYMCQHEMDDKEWWKEMQSNILGLLQKIEPNDPQVYETYTLALTQSKLSRHSHALTLDMNYTPTVIMKDFIDSLICNLWKILKLESFLVIFEKDQLQVLYEGLRFLSTILKEQPCKFDEKLWDFTVAVICDAGLIIFLHSQKNVKIDVELFDLLARIKLIVAEVEESVPQTLKFNHPRTNELGFGDSVLENLMEMTSSNVHSNAQSRVRTVQEDLIFLRSFFSEIVEWSNEHEELQTLWNCVVEVAYRVEFFIYPMMLGDIPKSISKSVDSITQDIKNIKTNVLKIFRAGENKSKSRK